MLAELAEVGQSDPVLRSSLHSLRALLADPSMLEANARGFVETLALSAAAALLRAHAPAAVADAFIASRLDGTFRHTYGAGMAHAESRAILERTLPAGLD